VGEGQTHKANDMATSQTSEVLQHLRRAVLLRDGAGLTDGQLLEDYLSRRDEAALAVLVHRHGPMVWGVCRRVLGNSHDAEDAFQATFLVLVRKAASIAAPELLANWLYGVAHQTARKARATVARRRARERQVAQMPEPAVTDQHLWNELQPLLDQELSCLSDKYRVAIVLCDLEGKTRQEAARQLGVPDGTLAARLARGRAMLARRLARRGLAVSGGVLAAVLSQNVGSASVPTSVVSSTIQVLNLSRAGEAVAAGVISTRVAALTEGVLKTMLLKKLEVVALLVAAVGLIGMATVVLCRQAAAQQRDPKPPAATRTDARPLAKTKTDKERLLGAWKVTSLIEDGKAIPKDDKRVKETHLYVTEDKATFKIVNSVEGTVDYTLDEKQKPKTIDFTAAGKTIKGIYSLEGDTLKLCLPMPPPSGEHERPGKFASDHDSRLTLIVLERDPRAPKFDGKKEEKLTEEQAKRREGARKLARVARAMRRYLDEHDGRFPPAAICNEDGKPLLSWRVALLPYLDETGLYDEFKLDEPWDSAHNKKLLEKMPAVYGAEGTETYYQVFTGPGTVFDGKEGVKSEDIKVPQQTVLMAEAAKAVPWTRPADLACHPGKALPGLGGSLFKDGFHLAGVGAEVRFVKSRFNEKILRVMITRDATESVDPLELDK
jgi:RNA polymerase sigma factor (sigma-70 family)